MPEDFAIIALPPVLIEAYGFETMLVCGVLLDGGAIIHGAAVPPPYALAGVACTFTADHVRIIERLFYEAMKPAEGRDYIHVRLMAPRAASRPDKPGAPVRYAPGKRTW